MSSSFAGLLFVELDGFAVEVAGCIGALVCIDDGEITDSQWITPQQALEKHRSGDIEMRGVALNPAVDQRHAPGDARRSQLGHEVLIRGAADAGDKRYVSR